MENFLLGMGTALWMGILTSISPCPLATNIAAISFIGKQVDRSGKILLSGLFYTLGRTFTYVVLGAFMVSSAQLMPAVSMFLQKYMNMLTGPVLFVVGLFLLDIFKFSLGGAIIPEAMQKRLAGAGPLGVFLLGVFFALSFCPVSAGLFFGSTISIAMQHSSRFVMPLLFGFGTALPVVGFAFVIAFSAHAVGKTFNKVTSFEKWARRISGIVFILVGIYLILLHNIKIL
jgi:cytochrome c biogenesis protein CcdA